MADRTNPGFRLDSVGAGSDDGRLTALERSHMEMAVQLGKHEISMTYLANDIKRGFDDLTTIIKPMIEKIQKLDDMLDSHQNFIIDQKSVQEEVKKGEKEQVKEKHALRMNALKALILAVCSGFGTYAWEHWISKYLIH